jgi:hypothetical protein
MGLHGLTKANVTLHTFWYEEEAVLAESIVCHSDTQVRFYRQFALQLEALESSCSFAPGSKQPTSGSIQYPGFSPVVSATSKQYQLTGNDPRPLYWRVQTQ